MSVKKYVITKSTVGGNIYGICKRIENGAAKNVP